MHSLDQIVKMNKQAEKQVIDLTDYKAGATLNLTTLKPVPFKNGYCVAITDNRTSQIDKTIELYRNIAKTMNNDLYLGVWWDSETNEYCLDLTLILSDKEQAIATAKTFKQKAIFDLNTMVEITI